MRKEKDNTRRIGGLLLDTLLLSFIVSFSLADFRMADVCSSITCEVSAADNELVLLHNYDVLCTNFIKQITQAQPAHIQSFGSTLKSPLLVVAGLVVVTGRQHLYNAICTNTSINAP